MNWDRIQGNWKQLKGQLKQRWGELTDDDLDRMEGKRDELAGKIQETYGVSRDEANRQLEEFSAGIREDELGAYGTTTPGRVYGRSQSGMADADRRGRTDEGF